MSRRSDVALDSSILEGVVLVLIEAFESLAVKGSHELIRGHIFAESVLKKGAVCL